MMRMTFHIPTALDPRFRFICAAKYTLSTIMFIEVIFRCLHGLVRCETREEPLLTLPVTIRYALSHDLRGLTLLRSLYALPMV